MGRGKHGMPLRSPAREILHIIKSRGPDLGS